MLKDNTKFGIAIGLIGPVLAMAGYCLWKAGMHNFWDYINIISMEINRKALIGMITFSLIANAASFTLFINKDKDYTAKGIFIITMVWAVVIIALKFLS